VYPTNLCTRQTRRNIDVPSSTMPLDTNGFHVVDYVVFALFLVASLVIGLYHACRCLSGGGGQKTVDEFLVADRQLSTLPVAISMFVSLISGVLVLGHPAEVYTRGVQFLVRSVGHVLAGFIAGALFVPLFFRLQVTSAYEVKTFNTGITMLILAKNRLPFSSNTIHADLVSLRFNSLRFNSELDLNK
jgi:Sodium:solute symporter family